MTAPEDRAQPNGTPPRQGDVFHDLRRRNERRARLMAARRELATNRERSLGPGRERRFPQGR